MRLVSVADQTGLNNLNLRYREIRQRIALSGRWNRGSRSKGWILKVKRLTPVDSRKTSAIDDHVARRCDEVAVVLLRAWHPETFIWCEQRPLHFVHAGTLDFQQAPVNLAAEVFEVGHVFNPLVDPEIARIMESAFGAQSLKMVPKRRDKSNTDHK